MTGQELLSILPKMKSVLSKVIDNIKPSHIKDTDLVRFYMTHRGLDVPVTVSPRAWADFNVQAILDRLEYVLSSNTKLVADESFEVHMATIHIPSGSGRSKITEITGRLSCLKRKRSLIMIKNDDHLCLARSLVVGVAHQNDDQFTRLIKGGPLQTYRARKLHDETGLPEGPVALTDIKSYEDVLDRQVIEIGRAHV